MIFDNGKDRFVSGSIARLQNWFYGSSVVPPSVEPQERQNDYNKHILEIVKVFQPMAVLIGRRIGGKVCRRRV